MKKIAKAILIISILSALSVNALDFYAAEGAMPVNNRSYTSNVIKLFDSAEKTIHVLMLQGGYYPERVEGINLTLYRSLFRAAERGVEVKVILDYSGFNPSQNTRNIELGEFLAKNKISVYYDDPEVTTHCKTLIVDSIYTVVGSTNWSYHALEKNNECSVLVKSSAVAKEYEKYFDRVLKSSSKTPGEADSSYFFIKKTDQAKETEEDQ